MAALHPRAWVATRLRIWENKRQRHQALALWRISSPGNIEDKAVREKESDQWTTKRHQPLLLVAKTRMVEI